MQLSKSLKSLPGKLEHFLIGHPDYANLHQRFVHIVCLGGAIVAIFSVPMNYFVVSGSFLTITNIIESAILIVAYLYSRVTGRYIHIAWITLLSLILFLSVQWFYNGGSSGGAQYYYMVLALVGSVIFKGWQKFLFTGISILTVLILSFLEYRNPQWVIAYDSDHSRIVDVAFSFTLTLLLIAIAVAFLSSHYAGLLTRIGRKSAELEEDLALARLLQEDLFSWNPDTAPHTDLALLYQPSRTIGGDFYDIKPISGALRILIADLKGHGINAALSAMLAKSEWNHSGHEMREPGEALKSFNDQLIRRYNNSILMSASLVDLYEDRIVFASAGFPEQYLVDRHSVTPLESSGPQLGILEHREYRSTVIPVSPRARLFLYSDALVEEPDQRGHLTGNEWLKEVLMRSVRNSDHLLSMVMERFTAITGKKSGETTDDLTVIISGPYGGGIDEIREKSGEEASLLS